MATGVLAEVERIMAALPRFATVELLQQHLYQHCFCNRFGEPVMDGAPGGSLLEEFSKANAGRDVWDRGWRITAVMAGGQIRAQKQEWSRTFWPGEFVSFEGPGVAPRAGIEVWAFFPRESTGMQPGYYFAYGNTAEEELEDNGLVRFYWAVRSGGAVALLRLVTERLNRFAVPFRLKMPVDRAYYNRLDAAVLYVHKRYYSVTRRLLMPVYEQIQQHLGQGSPLFTRPVAPGLGLAEDTGNSESFGMHRCRILAEAIWKGQPVKEYFASCGLEVERAYLNHGSVDQYGAEGDRRQETGDRSQETGDRRRESGDRSQETGDRSQETGGRSNSAARGRPSEFLDAAAAIGAKLCRDALWWGKRANWTGASMEYIDNTWVAAQRAFGGELYNGTSGIALFLGRLYGLTGEKEFRDVAEGALAQALAYAEGIHPHARAGFYSGATGIAYAALELGHSDTGMALLKKLLDDDAAQQGLDVVSGSAGAIPVFLRIHQRCPQQFLLDLAVRHGEHLVSTARKNEASWSWNTLNANAGRDLTGFSHGTAGIAWALLELHRAVGEARYREAAMEALAYERNSFSAAHQNWPDFRPQNERIPIGSGEPSYSLAWCHGAPGIGLSRVRAYEILKDEECRAEAEIALQTTSQLLREPALRTQNYSLCHGMGGNAELPLVASGVFEGDGLRAAAETVGRYGLEAYWRTRTPWPCGVTKGGETPNLMLGLAGIGYFYLRLHDPERVSSVLLVGPCGAES